MLLVQLRRAETPLQTTVYPASEYPASLTVTQMQITPVQFDE